jgi:3-phosphoshikimate 1-carboxyvinyltransferase
MASHRIVVPGDKSVSHRAVLFNALAVGEASISGLLGAEDVSRSVEAARRLGATVEQVGARVRVVGAPWRDAGEIDCGNSGTTARLLLGALAPRANARLVGDPSLSRRPMRVLDILARMGAETTGGGTLPVEVRRAALSGVEHRATVASAQVKSAVLLAGLGASGTTTYIEPVPTRDHTERLLAAMGAPLRVVDAADGARHLSVERGALGACDVRVPGDISSAAFWMVAAAIGEGVEVVLPGVGLNPTRTAVIDVLLRMGAEVRVHEEGGVEPIGEVRVRGRGLVGTTIAGTEVPRLIDELPVLAVAAAFADGDTVVRDAAELRVKESDRIATVVNGLRAIGVQAAALPDGFVVRGGGARGGHVGTEGDHRIAMAFSIAGIRVPVTVGETASINTSYPGFLAALEGMRVSV